MKKLRRNQQKFETFFVKFQTPFSQKIINTQLYISCKAFIPSIVFDSADRQMIHTIIYNQSPH